MAVVFSAAARAELPHPVHEPAQRAAPALGLIVELAAITPARRTARIGLRRIPVRLLILGGLVGIFLRRLRLVGLRLGFLRFRLVDGRAECSQFRRLRLAARSGAVRSAVHALLLLRLHGRKQRAVAVLRHHGRGIAPQQLLYLLPALAQRILVRARIEYRFDHARYGAQLVLLGGYDQLLRKGLLPVVEQYAALALQRGAYVALLQAVVLSGRGALLRRGGRYVCVPGRGGVLRCLRGRFGLLMLSAHRLRRRTARTPAARHRLIANVVQGRALYRSGRLRFARDACARDIFVLLRGRLRPGRLRAFERRFLLRFLAARGGRFLMGGFLTFDRLRPLRGILRVPGRVVRVVLGVLGYLAAALPAGRHRHLPAATAVLAVVILVVGLLRAAARARVPALPLLRSAAALPFLVTAVIGLVLLVLRDFLHYAHGLQPRHEPVARALRRGAVLLIPVLVPLLAAHARPGGPPARGCAALLALIGLWALLLRRRGCLAPLLQGHIVPAPDGLLLRRRSRRACAGQGHHVSSAPVRALGGRGLALGLSAPARARRILYLSGLSRVIVFRVAHDDSSIRNCRLRGSCDRMRGFAALFYPPRSVYMRPHLRAALAMALSSAL